MSLRVWPGQPFPLGATWDGEGVTVALFSERASAVELCLFDRARDAEESFRLLIPHPTDEGWDCDLPDLRPGQRYGYRVHGPYEPERGLRFNPTNLGSPPPSAGRARTSRQPRGTPRSACRRASSSTPRSSGGTTGSSARRGTARRSTSAT